jgi:16S rRNA (adenine1518-N6/adenine1519-N6)-dimethyltransferase
VSFKYKKSLGQNFLQDENVLKKIVSNVKVNSNDIIIEIGPGHGALTKYLVNLGCDVLAFEIDNTVESYLKKYYCDNLKVIYDDFMNIDLKKYNLDSYENIYIVANIPYYITTPIIEKIINSNINEKYMILMVQKEVADRFSANEGSNDYGSVTVYLNYFYNVIKLFDVSKNAFYPVPKVDSSIIKLERKDIESDIDKDKFFKFIKMCFRYKRKNIRNNLKGFDLDKVLNVLEKYNHNLSSRAEEFTLEEFIDLYKNIA